MPSQPALRIERLPSVLSRTGLSRSSVYAAMKSKTFPEQIKPAPRAIGFLSDEVDAWIAARLAARGGVSAIVLNNRPHTVN